MEARNIKRNKLIIFGITDVDEKLRIPQIITDESKANKVNLGHGCADDKHTQKIWTVMKEKKVGILQGIRCTAERTKIQKSELQNLHREVAERILKGEADLRIAYRPGVPVIIGKADKKSMST